MGGIGAAVGGILGAYGGYQDAKNAKKQAEKGIDTTEKTTRDPYGPATSHIQDILDEAKRIYGTGGYQGPMPYAWQNFLNNPTSPGIGSDATYGGSTRQTGMTGASGLSDKQIANRAARQERRDARQASQNAPSSASQPSQGGMMGGGMMGGSAGSQGGPQFTPQSGPFGYSQGIRDYMMQKYQNGGVGGYQPAMNFITGLLGGQSQNPFLTQAFQRVQSPLPDYFAKFK